MFSLSMIRVFRGLVDFLNVYLRAVKPMRYSSPCLSEQLPLGLEPLINRLHQTKRMTSELACQYLEAANLQVESLLPWADFEHPVTHSYGRQLLYSGGHFDILLISWAAGDWTAIHDHGATQWGAVQCFGPAEHVVYKFEHNVVNTLSVDRLIPRAINGVRPGLIHQMGNPEQYAFMSLHIYGRPAEPSWPLHRDPAQKSARVFDLFEETIQHTERGAFFCLEEADITERNYGVSGDMMATLRHHECMLERLCRILAGNGREAQLREQADRLAERIARLKSQDVAAPCR